MLGVGGHPIFRGNSKNKVSNTILPTVTTVALGRALISLWVPWHPIPYMVFWKKKSQDMNNHGVVTHR